MPLRRIRRIRRLPAPPLRRLWPLPVADRVGACDVLVLVATYGNGHVQAARALTEAVLSERPGTRVGTLDFFELVNPVLNAAARTAYMYSVRSAPALWREFYTRTGQVRPDSFWQRRLYHLGFGALRQVVQAARPRVVISTHPTPGGVMAQLREEGHAPGVAGVTVITDYVLHSQWVHPSTDLYLAPCAEVADELVAKGVRPDRVLVTGIPIRPHFSRPVDRQAVRERLGLKPWPPVVLVMTGAFGMMRGAVAACRAVAHLGVPVQVVLVTGHDRRLYRALSSTLAEAPNRVVLLGYVEAIHELMAASDLLVSKAGGLTVSEALAVGLPVVVYAPIPGQEEGNAAYLVRHGAGAVAPSAEEVGRLVETLVRDDERRLSMAERARHISRPDAAARGARAVLDLLPG